MRHRSEIVPMYITCVRRYVRAPRFRFRSLSTPFAFVSRRPRAAKTAPPIGWVGWLDIFCNDEMQDIGVSGALFGDDASRTCIGHRGGSVGHQRQEGVVVCGVCVDVEGGDDEARRPAGDAPTREGRRCV